MPSIRLARNSKRVIVQWVGIGAHTHACTGTHTHTHTHTKLDISECVGECHLSANLCKRALDVTAGVIVEATHNADILTINANVL